jgi:hypothetical protein
MLRRGDIIQLAGRECIVTMVNESRARAFPTELRQVEVTTSAGRHITFAAKLRPFDISPNSEVPVLRHAGETTAEAFMKRKGKEAYEPRT